jgi:hypothetical protein
VEEIIHPGALEAKSQLSEDLGEMKSQLSKQVARLRELRIKKVEQPGKKLSLQLWVTFSTTRANTTAWPVFFWGGNPRFRRILRNRRCGLAQRRRNDRCLDGSNDIYKVHRRALDGFEEIKVGQLGSLPFCRRELRARFPGKARDRDARRNVRSDPGGKERSTKKSTCCSRS